MTASASHKLEQKNPPPPPPSPNDARPKRQNSQVPQISLDPVEPALNELYTNSTRKRIPVQRRCTVIVRQESRAFRQSLIHSVRLESMRATDAEEGDVKKFMSSFFYQLVTKRRTTLRHTIFLAVAIAYATLGGAVFYFLERPAELEELAKMKATMEHRIHDFTRQLKNLTRQGGDPEAVDKLLKAAYIELMQLDGKYKNSIFFKAEGEHNRLWTYPHAVFYAGTVFTSIGYGSIWPTTDFTRLLTIIYATLTVPLTIVITRTIGQAVLVYVTKAYARILFKIREARGIATREADVIRLPIKVCTLCAAGYILAAASVVLLYDSFWGEASLDLFSAFYFMYLSLATIGLGDVMPANVPFSLVILAVIYFGLPIMRVVNRCTYIALENGLVGMFAIAEEVLGSKKEEKQVEDERTTANEQTSAPTVPRRIRSVSATEAIRDRDDPERTPPPKELLNNFTIHSVAQLMSARSDVYHGDFGRVKIRKQDLE